MKALIDKMKEHADGLEKCISTHVDLMGNPNCVITSSGYEKLGKMQKELSIYRENISSLENRSSCTCHSFFKKLPFIFSYKIHTFKEGTMYRCNKCHKYHSKVSGGK